MQREQWGTRVGFILAAAGSAIGLGNIWRFPYMAYENGGGAFLIPYFFALFTAGIPLLILEFGMGHKMEGSAPLTFRKLKEKWEWLGWWQVFVSFIISIYYVVIIAWALRFIAFSVGQTWGSDPAGFFVGSFLGLTDGPWILGGFRWDILAAVVFVWFLNWLILFGGVKKGIEVANKIFMPLLFALILVILVRGLTLPGAVDGLNFLFTPNFSKILDPQVWVNAYGQIFFTLSIAFAIMITYSSYLPEKSDINNNAFITAFANCGFSILAGMAVFSILGFMAQAQQVPFNEVVDSGVFLAFAAIPAAINELPMLQGFIGVLFFISIFVAGMSSEVSINEAVVSGLMDKLGTSRKKTVTIYILVAGLISLIFTTGAGLYILDITDHFINNFGVALAGLVEVILIGWFFNLGVIKKYVNTVSEFAVGNWWTICLKIVTPLVLGVMSIQNLLGDITTPYEGYPISALITMGWAAAIVAIVGGIIVSSMNWRNNSVLLSNKEVID